MTALTTLNAESLRALALEERSIVFDIASLALVSTSPQLANAYRRTIEKRLEQLSPETRAYIAGWWEAYRNGDAEVVAPGRVAECLAEYSIYHWLHAAMRGLCDEAQASLMREYLDHYATALNEAEATAPLPMRQRIALAALGRPEELNKALRKTYLTEEEQAELLRLQAIPKPWENLLFLFFYAWFGFAILAEDRMLNIALSLVVLGIANEVLALLLAARANGIRIPMGYWRYAAVFRFSLFLAAGFSSFLTVAELYRDTFQGILALANMGVPFAGSLASIYSLWRLRRKAATSIPSATLSRE